MPTFPEPESTPDGPAYEGRLLASADEELVEQGAGFDLGTLFSRRRILAMVGLGAGGAILAACAPVAGALSPSSSATPSATASATPSASVSATPTPTAPAYGDLTEIPDETAGPYPGDGSNGPNALTESGIVRSDLRSNIAGGGSVEGVPLQITLTIVDMAGGNIPFAGVAVYAWHCDAQGRYSMYSSGVEDQTWLRGVQVADAEGKVTFTSIVPGCYTGRWPHVHFEVYPTVNDITNSSAAISTSQLGFPESMFGEVYAQSTYSGSSNNLAGVTLASDNVFGEDGGVYQLATMTGSASAGFTASLLVPVDTATAPAGGGAPGGGPRG